MTSLITFSASKLDKRSRISQSSVSLSHRSPRGECPRPSLPELLAAEGLEKPEYTSGYVQRVRQQYLALIAANNTENASKSIPSNVSPHFNVNLNIKTPVAAKPDKREDLENSSIEKVVKQCEMITAITPVEEKFVSENKPKVSDITAPVNVRCTLEENNNNNNTSQSTQVPRSQLVSSLRAVFDKSSTIGHDATVSPARNSSSRPSVTSETFPRRNEFNLTTSVTSTITTTTTTFNQASINRPASPLSSLTIQPSQMKATTPLSTSSFQTTTEVAATQPSKPKQPQVFGERTIIFKGKYFQNQSNGNGNSTVDQIAFSKASHAPVVETKIERNAPSKVDTVDSISTHQQLFIDDFDVESENEVDETEGTATFKFTIIGAAAVITAKPMWLRRNKERSGHKIRFDDNIDIFGYNNGNSHGNNSFSYESSADGGKSGEVFEPLERDWSLNIAFSAKSTISSSIDFESHTSELGLRPITCPVSNAPSGAPSNGFCGPVFGGTRDRMDLVF